MQLVIANCYKNLARIVLGCLLLFSSYSSYGNTLTFNELYGKFSVTGLEFSDKVKALVGKKVTINGFMAPPLKAESQFFVLTKTPMAVCPFCSSDADWPEDILVVYLGKRQNFVQYNAMISVKGILEYGVSVDPDTGFVSLLRLREAQFDTL
ncbi:hypothetical protein EV693_11423 [Nicoletella semolina]|uniref:DUF3299 domain-containing protein n=1 Tax=Nicoletella semolina TaxID=271160 RepID=A0A4V2SJL6_9PAST|nr:hypothetical protein [Nicoletella semolina]MDH2925443.1 hypothetical protein [Nicoletella semolina]TCP16106.1 hypothetical protein EV693_11423 [Nicoletella semolina]